MKIPMTKTQATILIHRLHRPDRIAANLDADYDEIGMIVSLLHIGLSDISLDLGPAEDCNPELTSDVLADCIEGSTIASDYNATARMGGTPLIAAANLGQAGVALAKKITDYRKPLDPRNRPLDFPMY